MNLCTDQLLLMLADPERVLSVSWLSADPRESPVSAQASGFVLNHGFAEEILPLDPDLVIAGSVTTSYTVNLLERLGYEVLRVEQAGSLAGVRRNIRAIAAAIGDYEAGERLVRAMDNNLARIRARREPVPRRVLVYRPGGYTMGDGTLVDEILEEAGLVNVAASLGISGWAQISVEDVLRMRPDTIVIDSYRIDEPSLANNPIKHQALEKFARSTPILEVPGEWWSCGTPFSLAAANLLQRGLRTAGDGRDL
jgi:iron complex transport system substrate-binding protein